MVRFQTDMYCHCGANLWFSEDAERIGLYCPNCGVYARKRKNGVKPYMWRHVLRSMYDMYGSYYVRRRFP